MLPPMKNTIATRDVIVQVGDIDRAAAFYENVLGLEVFERRPRLIGIETGAFRLFLEPGAKSEPVFEFTVADLEAARRELLAAGCTLEEEDPRVPRCYLRDPQGLVFNLSQR
jgi:catechol 2,3-dioxygenase-like lactoylglutathione lyase family enzyme